MDLDADGAALASMRLGDEELDDLATLFQAVGSGPGHRVTDHPVAAVLLGERSTLLTLARERLGPAVRPVRLVLFDKTPERNWAVAWHQDRAIAVAERRAVEGFDPWSIKQGLLHVAPPHAVLASMLTVRAHLDPCDDTNAPLVVAKGSHRIGVVPADRAAEVATTFETATCLANPGEIWLYRTPILHMSRAAAKPHRRRVLQVDFSAESLPGGLVWAGVRALAER